MYRRSLEELQTDYFDYYLLHSVGGGTGIPLVRARYFDNGMMDFLLREREAGRVRNLGWSFHGDVRVFDYMLSLDIPWDFVQIQMNYADWRHAQDATSTPNTCTANWRNGIFRWSSWNRCWGDA